MAATTGSRTENHSTVDRLLLAGWDRPQTLDDWFDATTAMQRSYLEWVSCTFRMMAPQIPIHNAHE